MARATGRTACLARREGEAGNTQTARAARCAHCGSESGIEAEWERPLRKGLLPTRLPGSLPGRKARGEGEMTGRRRTERCRRIRPPPTQGRRNHEPIHRDQRLAHRQARGHQRPRRRRARTEPIRWSSSTSRPTSIRPTDGTTPTVATESGPIGPAADRSSEPAVSTERWLGPAAKPCTETCTGS